MEFRSGRMSSRGTYAMVPEKPLANEKRGGLHCKWNNPLPTPVINTNGVCCKESATNGRELLSGVREGPTMTL